jgi:hypothetical protein
MNVSEEDTSVRNDVSYLRFLVAAGLSKALVRDVAKRVTPELEICFNEKECQVKAKTTPPGKHVVMIS